MGPKRDTERDIPVFLAKTYAMIDAATGDIVGWSPSGDSFIIRDCDRFTEEVIPRFFKHKNFSSFIRQLNFYGFRKVKEPRKAPEARQRWEFRHDKFVRGRRDLLRDIKRKSYQDGAQAERVDLDGIRGEINVINKKLEALQGSWDHLVDMLQTVTGPLTMLDDTRVAAQGAPADGGGARHGTGGEQGRAAQPAEGPAEAAAAEGEEEERKPTAQGSPPRQPAAAPALPGFGTPQRAPASQAEDAEQADKDLMQLEDAGLEDIEQEFEFFNVAMPADGTPNTFDLDSIMNDTDPFGPLGPLGGLPAAGDAFDLGAASPMRTPPRVPNSVTPQRTSPADGDEKSRAKLKARLAALSSEQQDQVVNRIAKLILSGRRQTVAEAARAADGSKHATCGASAEDQPIKTSPAAAGAAAECAP